MSYSISHLLPDPPGVVLTTPFHVGVGASNMCQMGNLVASAWLHTASPSNSNASKHPSPIVPALELSERGRNETGGETLP